MSFSSSQPLSPYLRQHVNQAIQWLPWSHETLQKAKSEDKPLLLTIGYASCHWCQEMSRNCYQDDYIASLMNNHFITILVDREEMPEIDHIYMEAVRMFDQTAGWPLHAFCLPDGRPFWGGTYFPKEDLGTGLIPWSQVLIRISEHFRTAKHELIENANNVIANLCHANQANCSSAKDWDHSLLARAVDTFCECHDAVNGGFTPAPKFPSPMKMDFLLSMKQTHYLRSRNEKLNTVDRCISKTLSVLSDSGVHDHLGGGFFRYCNDEKWTQPHYEKMLSDNALLLSTFSRVERAQKDGKYHPIIRGIITWLNREMGCPSTGYASSLSAESMGIEGGLYEWEKSDMITALGIEEGKQFFSILPPLSNAHDRRLPQVIISENVTIEKQNLWIKRLREIRGQRPSCERDEKRLLGHNALLVSALIEAAIALDDKILLDDAIKLEQWITREFQINDLNIRSFLYPGGAVDSRGNLDDYSFWIRAMLDLQSVAPFLGNENLNHYLEKALEFTEEVIRKFKDFENPGFFFSEKNCQTPLPCRKKIWFDNSTPSGNSTLLRIFSELHYFTHDRKWRIEFEGNLCGYVKLATDAPEGIAYALTAICHEATGFCSVVIPKSKMTFEILSKLPARSFSITESDQVKKFQVINGRSEIILSTEEEAELLDFLES